MAATNNSTVNTLLHMSLTWGPRLVNIGIDASSPLTGFRVLIPLSPLDDDDDDDVLVVAVLISLSS